MSTILIVDDSKDLLEMFSLVFSRHNFTCKVANSIDKMFEQLQVKIPDIIIMDVFIGQKDGREICKELKSRNGLKQTPIILMSASPNKLMTYRDYGADDILEKPFDIKKVISKVTALQSKSRVA